MRMSGGLLSGLRPTAAVVGTPKKSALQGTVSAIRAETWEVINRTLLASARQEKVEAGKVVRLDSTVAAALML